MRKLTLSLLSFTLGISVMPFAQAAPGAQQQLLEQVRLGETTKREDLVRQSLYRLELMAPDDPDVIAARLRYLLRQGDNAGAQKQMARLNALAPNASATKASRITMALSTPEGRQALQEARLQGPLPLTRRCLTTVRQQAIWRRNTGFRWRKSRRDTTKPLLS